MKHISTALKTESVVPIQMLCTFLFLSCELKYSFVGIQIRIVDYGMFCAELVKVSVYSRCIHLNSLIF